MRPQAGIHDFLCRNEGKLWIPACARMTRGQRRGVNPFATRFNTKCRKERHDGVAVGVYAVDLFIASLDQAVGSAVLPVINSIPA